MFVLRLMRRLLQMTRNMDEKKTEFGSIMGNVNHSFNERRLIQLTMFGVKLTRWSICLQDDHVL